MCPPASCSWISRVCALTSIWLVLLGTARASNAGEQIEEGDFVIRSWDRREGMPVSVVNEIQRAPNGYLWIATQKGLVRFDGERFKLFDAQSNPELRSNRVDCVRADSNGTVYVGTPSSLICYPDGRPAAASSLSVVRILGREHLPRQVTAMSGRLRPTTR